MSGCGPFIERAPSEEITSFGKFCHQRFT